MVKNFMLIPINTVNKLAIDKIIKCNEITSRYGLMISPVEARELVETRAHALNSTGRIEFSGGIINKMIQIFCDSSFLTQHVTTLNDLIETFYYFKNETLDEISDDELISLMKKYFDQNCQGSVELLQNRELETLARNIRYGVSNYSDLRANLRSDYEKYFSEEFDDE